MELFFRAFFFLLYHHFAWGYEAFASFVSAGLWSSWVEAGVSYLIGPKVLELGIGPGRIQIKMSQLGMEPAGLDESHQMVKIAQLNIRRAMRLPGISSNNRWKSPILVRARAQSIPFSPHSFNTVIASFPTRYILEPATLAEVHRVLTPDGRLVVTLSGWITGHKLSHRLAALLFRITGESEEWNPAWAVPFENAGFQVSIQQVTLPSSRVLILLAQKMPSPQKDQ